MKKVDRLFLNMGTMRAGTTWLFNIIRDHPDLYFTPQKELHFLYDYYNGTHLQSLELPIWEKRYIASMSQPGGETHATRMEHLDYVYAWGRLLIQRGEEPTMDYYHSLFSLRGDEKWSCDFCNLTSQLNKEQLEDIKSNFGEVKVMYIMRDPLERLWSHFVYNNEKNGPVEYEEENWTKEMYKDWLTNHKRWIPKAWDYARAVEMGQEVFGDNFFVFFYEDLKAHPVNAIKRIEHQLGIPFYKGYNEDKINQYVNTASLGNPMWENFVRFTRPYLNQQVSKLSTLIDLHPSWSDYEIST